MPLMREGFGDREDVEAGFEVEEAGKEIAEGEDVIDFEASEAFHPAGARQQGNPRICRQDGQEDKRKLCVKCIRPFIANHIKH